MSKEYLTIRIYSTKDAREAILGQMADNLNATFQMDDGKYKRQVEFSCNNPQLCNILGSSGADQEGIESEVTLYGEDLLSEFSGRFWSCHEQFGDVVRLNIGIATECDYYGNLISADIEKFIRPFCNVLKGVSCVIDINDGFGNIDPFFYDGGTGELTQVKFSPEDLRHKDTEGFTFIRTSFIFEWRQAVVAALCSRLLFGKCDHVDPAYFASLVVDNDVEKITDAAKKLNADNLLSCIDLYELYKKGHFDGVATVLRVTPDKQPIKQPGLLLAHFVALDDIDSVEVILDKVSIGKRSKTGICKELRKYPDNASKQLVIDRLELPEEEARYDDPNLRDPLEPVKPCAGYFEAETQYLGVRVTLKNGTVLKDGTIDYWQYIGVKATKQRNEARQKLFGLCKTGNDVVRALCVMFPTSTEWVKTVKTANRPLEKEAFCGLLGDVARGLKAVESVDQIDNIVALGRTYGPDFSVTTDIDPQLDTFYEPTCFDDGGVSGWSAIDMYDDFTENAWDLKWDFTTGECVYDKG
ncbi:hypothetical protein ACTQXJ_01495 [Collinsella sp. LCP19S3_C6]|uniref:hypothetical protein n=1 Tax=unclassified Collinsella TaxID=2637548 RepID=UPI003F8DCB79